MKDTAQHPDDFANDFEAAFARLQIRIETACAAESEWPDQVAAGVRAALRFAAADPGSAKVLTSDALADEAVQFVLTPYLGTEEARRLAAAAG